MKKFIVKYTDRYDDLSTVWVMANSKEDAKHVARNEYWDIVCIVSVVESK